MRQRYCNCQSFRASRGNLKRAKTSVVLRDTQVGGKEPGRQVLEAHTHIRGYGEGRGSFMIFGMATHFNMPKENAVPVPL